MKSISVKLISLFLCILMLTASLAACGKKDTPAPTPDSESNGGSTVTGEPVKEYETDANGFVKDSITQTFGGTELNILTWDEKRDYLFPEQNSDASTVSSAVYLRNMNVAERLDVFFNVTSVPGEWSKYDTFMMQAELAGELGFDIICSYSLWPSMLAARGVLYNLNNLTYPELDMPWWPESIREWEQYGSLFFVADNASIPVINSMELCFANLNLLQTYGLEDPIQLVLNKEWTVEKLISLAKVFGDNFNEEDERSVYGIAVEEVSRLDAFYYGAGFHVTQNNDDGKAELALSAQREQVTSYISRLGQMFQYNWSTILSNSVKLMKENRTAFQVGYMSNLNSLTEANYAPLPMPMLDSNQESYYTICHNGFNVWCIPDSAANAETSAVVIEAFASSAYRELAPFYYEKNLKLHYSSSDDGAAVFDVIRNSVIYDFGRISTKAIGTTESAFRKCFWDYDTSTPSFREIYTSKLDGSLETYETNLAELLEAYRKYQSR